MSHVHDWHPVGYIPLLNESGELSPDRIDMDTCAGCNGCGCIVSNVARAQLEAVEALARSVAHLADGAYCEVCSADFTNNEMHSTTCVVPQARRLVGE